MEAFLFLKNISFFLPDNQQGTTGTKKVQLKLDLKSTSHHCFFV